MMCYDCVLILYQELENLICHMAIPSTTSQGPWELKYRPKMEGSEAISFKVSCCSIYMSRLDPPPGVEYEGSEVVFPTSCFETSNGYTRFPQNQNSKIQTQNQNAKIKLQDPKSKLQDPNPKIKTPRSKPPKSKTPKSKIKTYISFWFMTGPPKKNWHEFFLANHQHNEQNIKTEIIKKNLAIDFFP